MDMPGMATTATTSAASMATSATAMSMSSTSMTMSEMAMVFFTSATTPLFSAQWTPTGDGPYAGTCIFLIVLAALHRILVAFGRVYFDRSAGAGAGAGQVSKVLSEEEYVGEKRPMIQRVRDVLGETPFHVGTEAARGVYEVIVSGISYLLMLAVMTMNVGYFMSVLGGIFLGVFLTGRIAGIQGHL